MKPIHSYIWEFKQPAQESDGNENVKKSIGLLTSKAITLYLQHAFC